MNIDVKPNRMERDKSANSSSITVTPAETLLYRLTALGVDYIFINAGTDYPPMIEGMSKDSSMQSKFRTSWFALMRMRRWAWHRATTSPPGSHRPS